MAGPGKPGRKRKDSTVIEPEPENFDLFGEDLAEVFDALPGEEKVISLFRIPASGPPSFLIALSPEGLRNLSMIQDEFGGGKYKAVAKNYETGEKVERTFSIEGEAKVKGSKIITKDPKTGFFRPKSEWTREEGYQLASDNNTDPVIRLLEKQIDKLEAEVSLLKGGQANGHTPNMSDLVNLLVQAKELIAPQSPVNQSTMDVTTLFNAMTKGIDLVNERERDNDKPIWMDLVRELIPQVQQIVNKVAMAPAPKGPTQPATTQPPKDVTPKTPFQALIPTLEPYKQTFIDAAANDDNPELLIPLVAARIPPDKKPEIIKWVQEGKWFDDLVSMDQRISLQRGWWQDFVGGLIIELGGQQPPETPVEDGEKLE